MINTKLKHWDNQFRTRIIRIEADLVEKNDLEKEGLKIATYFLGEKRLGFSGKKLSFDH